MYFGGSLASYSMNWVIGYRMPPAWVPRSPSMIASMWFQGIENAISWSWVCPKIRSPEQGRMTCGASLFIAVTMISLQSIRPPKDEVSLPPRFQSAAWVSRITWAGLA